MPERDANQTILRCYRCGMSLEALSLPLARLDLCPDCGVELHVCRMCRHYAPSAPDACDEDDAPAVRNKTTANFCDYFAPDATAFDGNERRAEQKARANLDALFGKPSANEPQQAADAESDDAIRRAAEDLFKK
jgi:predicted RNA-binding Zn-ribbon protein involved in translation (DUF1610 family)